MSLISQKKNILTFLISIFSLFVVGITLLSIVFPALIISNFGIHSNNLESFEPGNNSLVILLSNLLVLAFVIAYYKNKLPLQLHKLISCIPKKQLSRKITLIVIFLILLPYTIFTIPELFIDEASQAPDYEIFLAAKEIFPFGKTTFTEATEQNDRYVRMILLIASLEIFQNVKIIPFIGSIALLITTYFFTKEITKNRFAGIVSILVLIGLYRIADVVMGVMANIFYLEKGFNIVEKIIKRSKKPTNIPVEWVRVQIKETTEVNGVRFPSGIQIDVTDEDAKKMIEGSKAILLEDLEKKDEA